jgi:hypothetical protein
MEPEGSPKRLNTVNIITVCFIYSLILSFPLRLGLPGALFLWVFVLKYASVHFSPHAITVIILYGAKIESLLNFTQWSFHMALVAPSVSRTRTLADSENCSCLVHHTANSANSFPTVRDNLSFPSSKVPTFRDNLSLSASEVFEDGTVRLYRTFGKNLPLLAA